MRFWLDKGVDGFRVDAMHKLFEAEDFRDEPLSGKTDNPLSYDYTRHDFVDHLAENYNISRQWRRLMDEYDSRAMLIEAYANISKSMDYYKAGAQFPFNFGFISDLSNDTTAEELKSLIDNWIDNMPKGSTANWVVSIKITVIAVISIKLYVHLVI